MTKIRLMNHKLVPKLMELVGLDPEIPVRSIMIRCEMERAPVCEIEFAPFTDASEGDGSIIETTSIEDEFRRFEKVKP